MKNTQENLSTLTIWSRNVTTSTREPRTCAWIRADIWRQDGAICSKNRKIVPYHRCARIPRLTVSVPDYGSWLCLTPRLVNNLRLWEKMNNVFVSWLSCIGLSKRFCITVPRKNPETLRETKSGSKMREFGWNIGGRWQWNKSKRSDFLFDLSRSLRDRDSTRITTIIVLLLFSGTLES